MSLFLLLSLGSIIYFTFIWNDDGLIYCLTHKQTEGAFGGWFICNIITILLALLLVITLSFGICVVYSVFDKTAEDYWEFNINALEDNLVTQGEIHGGMFAVRGYFDGELSYFYSRTTNRGEIIEHIPANKTYLKYDNTVHPKVEVHTKELGIPKWIRDLIFNLDTTQIDYYVIIVPEGTLKNSGEYNIDMS